MKKVILVARMLWIIPLALVGLTIHQVWVARSVAKTMSEGHRVIAEVTFFDVKEMVAQTHGILDLEIPDSNLGSYSKRLTVPAAWLYDMGELDSLAVYVLDGGTQDVVIENLAQVQARTAWVNAMVALLFALMIAVPVWLWGRYLKREGDPAYRQSEEDLLDDEQIP